MPPNVSHTQKSVCGMSLWNVPLQPILIKSNYCSKLVNRGEDISAKLNKSTVLFNDPL